METIVRTLIFVSFYSLFMERLISCYQRLVEEPTAFDERMIENDARFPSFTLCAFEERDLEPGTQDHIESFEDVMTAVEFAKAKYTGEMEIMKLSKDL